MNRRQLLAAIGTLSGGGAVAMGTGAFTSVEADRDVTVAVADDASAFLAISDTGNANKEYVIENNGEFGLDLTDSNSTSGGGAGVNTDAVTVFEDLFEIQNQGTQDIEVEVDPLTFVETGSGTTLIVLVVPDTNFPTTTISTGSTETYHMVVDVYPGGTAPEVSDTITITGEATS